MKRVKKLNHSYKPFEKWDWRSFGNPRKKISVDEFVAQNINNSVFYIATDSQNYSKKKTCVFTTAIIVHYMGEDGIGAGGRAIIHTDKVSYMESLRQRLLMEAFRSLEAAWYTDKIIPEDNVITVQLDVNKNLKFKSAKYHEELVGLVIAQGFKCATKPDAWGASSVADKKC